MSDKKTSGFSLFGFKIGKREEELKKQAVQPSFVPPSNEDGALTITSAAQFGTSALDLDGSAKNDIELITRYREMAMQPEVESAIEDIVNEAIVRNDDGKNLEIVLDDLKQSDKIKKAIKEEFDTILKLLNYDNMGTDIFRRYYVDGRLFYHIIVDIDNPQKGIKELRYIDPRKIRKIREVKKQKDSVSGIDVITKVNEYFIFSERITSGPTNSPIGGIKIAPDSILNVTSGLMDARRGMVLSYLHKAIKPLNQLRMIEDAVVIYRLSRAPERRVFYVDVGNLPRIKAEQYVRDIMTKYKNKLVYDACLDLNTMIPLMDGRKLLLKEIIIEYNDGKELWAYSCNPETGEFAPGLITWAGVTKLDQPVVRVLLENRKELICTLDHKFPVWGKGFVEAQQLDYDDVIMAFDGENNSDEKKGIKVIEMEILKETMNVGTLTIDGDEIHHNYHTFALDVGIYTKNSTGEVRDDRRHLSMTEDFWMPRRSDNKSTEITTLPAGCFSMDTKVSLLDGRELSIKEIENELEKGEELWTYSCQPNTGKVVPGLISWAGVTQKSAEVMELTLDNGETIICTPEHKFPVYGKLYKEAREFSIGDSLIPLYRRKSPLKTNGSYTYEQIFDNYDKKWKFTHRVVSSSLKDIFVQYKKYDEYYCDGNYDITHHMDFNRYNNSPTNLCFMSWKDHSKLHQDNIQILKERPDYIEKLKLGVNKYYENRTQEEKIKHSKRSSNTWKNFTEEEYNSICKKISEGIVRYFENLDENEREIRAEINKKNFKKGNESFVKKLLENEEYKQQISELRKSEWNEERRKDCSKKFAEQSKIWWESEEHRANHKKRQKVEFSHSMLLKTIDLVKDKTTHQITLLDVLNELNNDPILLEELKELNKSKSVPNWNVNDGFTASLITKLVKEFGYDSWKDFRVKESLHNHRIVGIRYLDDPIEVGTLTIDFNELYHDYHTFALSCGVFVFNSNLGQMQDVEYFEKKLYKSLNVPVSRLDPQQAVSIGRSTEITRDELKFSRFIDKLRNKFSELFDSALRVQLILKGICTEEEWIEFKESINYDFIKDNKFVELKEAELMQERLGILAIIDQYSGKYYSKNWIQKNVLRLKDIEIETMEREMESEKEIDFSDQAEDQQKQIQLQAQAMQLQNELMPQQDPQIDANSPEQQSTVDPARALHKTEPEQIKSAKKTNNPYHIQQ